MQSPYEMVDGEIIEHKMSFEMQLNALNNKDRKRDKVEPVNIPDVFKECSCGEVFKLASISICEPCYDKFDTHNQYLSVMKRNKEWIGQ